MMSQAGCNNSRAKLLAITARRVIFGAAKREREAHEAGLFEAGGAAGGEMSRCGGIRRSLNGHPRELGR
jgi:hypothetical protein